MPGIQQFDTTMRLLQRVLDLREKNQEIIGSNIANAETPGYAAKSFSFEEQLKGALFTNELQPTRTQPGHIPLGPTELEHVTGTVTSREDTTGIGDENSVSVDQEMVKLSQNEIMYEAAITMLNKKLSAVKYAINGGA
ncbi:flagellar basal body rod protein FlgB [Desulfobulbus rhabdoformis]|jgi:flagellar basal-body rod protein FlgB|uniref:flagellar basal body rod protein FlgB n=1 Tax=Desulfobulbus rhabdoformis TaxID=34032 RepID=UPI0019648C50|nr:flagellar basal body rod protein FlgB [Desulfobulbus rhabdoformis]MBM9615162.1 flagellar basal body rod protein FlgB [Desulfobulbus rhabdoformis]